MHVASRSIRNLGANGIVGGGLAIGDGAALAIKQRGGREVVRRVLQRRRVGQRDVARVDEPGGDLEPAGHLRPGEQPVRRLDPDPRLRPGRSPVRAGPRATACPGCTVDGNDAAVVYGAMQEPLRRARAGEGPIAPRMHDVPSRRPPRERPRPVPAGRPADPLEGPRPARSSSASAWPGRRRRGRCHRDRRTRRSGDGRGRRVRRRRAPIRRSTSSAPRLRLPKLPEFVQAGRTTNTAASEPQGTRMKYREALRAALLEEMERRRVGLLRRRGDRRAGRLVQGDRRPARRVRPGPRHRHSAERGRLRRAWASVPRSPASGRWSRSCSSTSCSRRWTRS